MKYVKIRVMGIICFGTLQALSVQALTGRVGLTVMELTDEVLAAEVARFGIDLGGDPYYSGAVSRSARVARRGGGFYLPNCCRSGQILLASRRSHVVDRVTRCDIRDKTYETNDTF